MTDVERFIERFAEFGENPSPERYEALFDPTAGVVFHPGMVEPLPRTRVGEYMAHILETFPGFRFEVAAWSAVEDRVFVETVASATLDGRPITWPAMYSITLRGDRALFGRAYFDRVPMLARISPSMTLREADALGMPAPELLEA